MALRHMPNLLCLLIATALPTLLPGESTYRAGMPSPVDENAEHEMVREAVRSGRNVPLREILADAFRRHPGTLLEVEIESDEYEILILGDNGVVMELEYDPRNGKFLEMERD